MTAPLLAGCSLNRTAARVTGGVIDEGLGSVFSQSDVQYAREALPGNLQLIEILIANDPKNKGLLINAAQGFCGYAFMFLEDGEPERASGFYLKGRAYAEKALNGRSPAQARKKDAPALFWATFCKASYININRDKPEAIAEIPSIEPAALRLLELAPSYYYNGARSIMGAYYSIRPRMLGGDPEKAKEHFEAAAEGAGAGFLLNRYMAARMYAPAALDEEFFVSTLEAVLAAELKEDGTRLANEVAKIKARALLEEKDELF
jgi:hypothetical protein